MPQTDIGSAIASDLTGTVDDYSVDTKSTDAAGAQKETAWTNEKWSQYLGYYKAIPELAAAIDARATWTIGKGFKSDIETEAILGTITGWGADTFNTILENGVRTYQIGGDSFAEIIRDEDGELINLKPLDPGAMKIVVNEQGIVIRYEQISKVKKAPKKFSPFEIFHLPRNRVADEIHGVSVIPAIEEIILMRNEAMADYKQVMHRFVKPRWIFHLDTDDTSKIAAFKRKMDKANQDGENMYIPKDAVVPEMMATAPNATLNPLPWIQALNQYFFQACGVPAIILGNSQEFTEATAKIAYLAFQQSVEEEQLFIEEQVYLQLGFMIELEFPASLENELLSDKKKDVEQGAAQPAETTATMEGNK